MATSQTSICNDALNLVPAGSIVSMSENSFQAEKCREQWPSAVAELIEEACWTHLNTRSALALITNDRQNEWAYAYAMPADLASPIRLLPPQTPGGSAEYLQAGQRVAQTQELHTGQGVPYEISGTTIYSHTADAVLEYVRQDNATPLMRPLWRRALYTLLASKIVLAITKDQSRRISLAQEARLRIDEAIAKSGNENVITYGDDLPDLIVALWS